MFLETLSVREGWSATADVVVVVRVEVEPVWSSNQEVTVEVIGANGGAVDYVTQSTDNLNEWEIDGGSVYVGREIGIRASVDGVSDIKWVTLLKREVSTVEVERDEITVNPRASGYVVRARVNEDASYRDVSFESSDDVIELSNVERDEEWYYVTLTIGADVTVNGEYYITVTSVDNPVVSAVVRLNVEAVYGSEIGKQSKVLFYNIIVKLFL